jgi:uncharacterized protein
VAAARDAGQDLVNLPLTDQLCLRCGLCCNGVLFRDVEVQPGDDAEMLRRLGLPLKKVNARPSPEAFQKERAPQPCALLGADCKCAIYANRPLRCRQFECALLLEVKAGACSVDQALKTIRDAQKRAAKALRLLRELGNEEEHLTVAHRFRRVKRKMESGAIDPALRGKFSELSLAMHRLNLRLSESFYPA